MVRIMACVPVRGMVSADFLINLINRMDEYAVEFRQKLLFSAAVPLDVARNELVDVALKQDPRVEYIWFIDTDSIIPRKLLYQLIECGSTVASALYFRKLFPYDPLMYKKEGDRYNPIREFKYGEIISVDAVGMGCCLIDTRVFPYLEKPYFKFEWDGDKVISEDIYFCNKVKEAGFEVKVNTDALIGHWGGMITNLQFENAKPMTKL